MALVIDSSPLSPTCNSYVGEAEALEYVRTRITDEAVQTSWEDLDTPVRRAYLVNATRQLDSAAEWIGQRYSLDQRLDWPRAEAVVDGFVLDSLSVPQAVKDATVEMAIWLMSNDGAPSVTQTSAFDSIAVGPLDIKFNSDTAPARDKFFPDTVPYMLKKYGSFSNPSTPSSRTMYTARLVRA